MMSAESPSTEGQMHLSYNFDLSNLQTFELTKPVFLKTQIFSVNSRNLTMYAIFTYQICEPKKGGI